MPDDPFQTGFNIYFTMVAVHSADFNFHFIHMIMFIILSTVYHIFIFTAIIFILDGNMINVKFVQQYFLYRCLNVFSFTDPDIRFQINMTFKMDILIT